VSFSVYFVIYASHFIISRNDTTEWQIYVCKNTLIFSSKFICCLFQQHVSKKLVQRCAYACIFKVNRSAKNQCKESRNRIWGFLCRSDDVAEDWIPPGPVAVGDDVGRVGDEWSVVCVELARLVRTTVVVRVTDWWQRTVHHALQTTIHLDSARHFVDHLLSQTCRVVPTWVNVK